MYMYIVLTYREYFSIIAVMCHVSINDKKDLGTQPNSYDKYKIQNSMVHTPSSVYGGSLLLLRYTKETEIKAEMPK